MAKGAPRTIDQPDDVFSNKKRNSEPVRTLETGFLRQFEPSNSQYRQRFPRSSFSLAI